jgi:hypothetical protein
VGALLLDGEREMKWQPMTKDGVHDYTHPSTADHAESDLNYVAGLEAHLDEGGDASAQNMRDIIAMVRWNATGLIDRLVAMSDIGWEDISTAPKDGTLILVYGPKPPLAGALPNIGLGLGAESLKDMGVVSWREYGFDDYVDSGNGNYRKVYVSRGGWSGSSSSYSTITTPTHWMPLPDAPHD